VNRLRVYAGLCRFVLPWAMWIALLGCAQPARPLAAAELRAGAAAKARRDLIFDRMRR